MDIALSIEKILPAAEYSGSVTANTPEAWNSVVWQDMRCDKPTWAGLQAAWFAVKIETTATEIMDKIQARLDAFARTLAYDGILSACTYATSSVEIYHIEGQYSVDIRDATWAKAFELLKAIQPQVEAGGAVPTWDEIEAQLPSLAWPEGSRGYTVPEAKRESA